MLGDSIRVDTGADISMLPLDYRQSLAIEDEHAIFETYITTPNSSRRIPKLVFMVDFLLADFGSYPDFTDVHVIFGDTPVPLLGIWTALEHKSLICEFRGMTTSF
jgi:hypothetical protein